MPNRSEWYYTFFGAEMIGAVIVPVNTRFKVQELKYILKASDATTFVFVDQLLNIDFVSMCLEICPEVKESQPGELKSQELPYLRNVICLSERNYPGMYNFENFINLSSGVSDDEFRKMQRNVSPNDTGIILYTSGTTSVPKGAELIHYSLVRSAYMIGQRFSTTKDDRAITAMPFFHVAGLCIILLQGCIYGAALVTLEYFEVEEFLSLIQREKCSIICINDAMVTMATQHESFAKYDISTLRTGYTAGTERTVKTVYEQLGIRGIVPGYGMTESCGAGSLGSPDETLEVRMNTFGKIVPGLEMKVIDPDSGRTLGTGEEGEILVRGWCLTKGYYKMPEQTEKAIDKDGWFHTGDLGRIDENNYLKFTGRLGDVFRSGGENVSPSEVETYLYTYPKVKQVSVTSVPDERLGEICVAFIILKEGESCTEQEIIDFCKGKVASFKVPRHVRFVNDFEYSASGKIKKFRLREELSKELGLEIRGQHATG
jgi:fatty-acyl-CoA synthase